jgi:protein-L-isoaspartate(D-aspartate) O-methyltransferase
VRRTGSQPSPKQTQNGVRFVPDDRGRPFLGASNTVATEPSTPCTLGRNPILLVPLAVVASGGAILLFWSDVFHRTLNSDSAFAAGRDKPAGHDEEGRFATARRQMVAEQLANRDIVDPRVLEVMGCVPRECFVPEGQRNRAYEDYPLPIGLDQTISQPYIVALMTQLVRPSPSDRTLDVGVGSGYQSAILAAVCRHVYGVEILDPLATAARQRLASLGYANVTVRCGDGRRGWPEQAPFDVIIVGAAPEQVPQPLIHQLAPGGRLVIPVGTYIQELLLIEKRLDGTLHRSRVAPVQFVPMTGDARAMQGP